MTSALVAERLRALRVVPVLRLGSREAGERAVACLVEAGFGTVEVTLTMPGALTLIAGLRRSSDPGFLVGAGTVLDLDMARACVEAGADYLVSPCLVRGLAGAAREASRACLIGGYTPGEVLAAHREGADAIKVFPASTGGPGHVAALHAVFPEIRLCPTGGINAQTMHDYFAAGAAFVGAGNDIIDAAALAAGDKRRVIAHARRFLQH